MAGTEKMADHGTVSGFHEAPANHSLLRQYSIPSQASRPSSGYGPDGCETMATTSFESNSILTPAPLDQQQPESHLTGYFDIAPTASFNGQQQQPPQYGPVYQSGLPSVGMTTNLLGQQPVYFQHQNQEALAHAQHPRPGLYPVNHLQHLQPQYIQPLPYGIQNVNMSAEQQEQLWIAQAQARAILSNVYAPFSFNNHMSTPIERSLSDMGPRASTHSFSQAQMGNINNGQRPGSSKSMSAFSQHSFQSVPELPCRPFTPPQQMSESSNAPSPFNPASPPHQVATEAIELTGSSHATPHSHVACQHDHSQAFQTAPSFPAPAAPPSHHSSNRASVDFSVTQSPSKTLGEPFAKLNFDDVFMADGSIGADFDINAPSPSGSETDVSDGEIIAHRPTGVTDAEIASYLEEDSQDEKYPLKCKYPKCDKRFARNENGKNHVQTHLEDRPWHCNMCDKQFTRQHDAKRHARGHLTTKEYRCECGFTASRKDAYTRHLDRITCDAQKRKFPGLVKSRAKRGRPRKERPLSTDENRITKSPFKASPRKKQRARQQELECAFGTEHPDSQPSPSLGSHQYGPIGGFSDEFSAPMPQIKEDVVFFGEYSNDLTPPRSPTGAYSTGAVSPSKQNANFSPVNNHATPPGSPPALTNSPAASSMGDEMPSSVMQSGFCNAWSSEEQALFTLMGAGEVKDDSTYFYQDQAAM